MRYPPMESLNWIIPHRVFLNKRKTRFFHQPARCRTRPLSPSLGPFNLNTIEGTTRSRQRSSRACDFAQNFGGEGEGILNHEAPASGRKATSVGVWEGRPKQKPPEFRPGVEGRRVAAQRSLSGTSENPLITWVPRRSFSPFSPSSTSFLSSSSFLSSHSSELPARPRVPEQRPAWQGRRPARR